MAEEQMEKVVSNDAIQCAVNWTRGFHNLPEEMLEMIFSYCTEKEIASSLSRVCTRWWVISCRSSLWKRLEFRGSRLNMSSIYYRLEHAPLLQAVSFIDVPGVEEAVNKISSYNKKIKKVVIRFCPVASESKLQASLLAVVRHCPLIEALDLKGTDVSITSLHSELHKLKHLYHLNLGFNVCLRVQDMQLIGRNCHALTELSLFQWGSYRTIITEQDAVFIFEQLHKQLISLKFDMLYLGPPVFQAILKCRKLERLALNHVCGAIGISMAVQLPPVKKLTLRHSTVSAEKFCMMLSTPGFRLIKFDVSHCWCMDEKCLEALASTCYATLRHLSIKCCKHITEDGLGYILHHFPHLTYLNAAHIGNMTLKLLDKIPKHLPNLKILIMDKELEQEHRLLFHIASRFPELKILQSNSRWSKAEYLYSRPQ